MPQEERKKNKLLQVVFLYIAVFIIISFPLAFEVINPSNPWNCWDESGYFETGKKLFCVFFIEHDFFNPIWLERLDNYGTPNPRIALYIIGAFDMIAAKVHALCVIEHFYVMRMLMAALSSACVVLFYLLVRSTAGATAAFFAAGLILLNPFFRSVQTSFLLEIPMLFFTLLALLNLVRVDKNAAAGFFDVEGMALFAIFMGMAVGCKLYAAALAGLFIAVAYRYSGMFGGTKMVLAIAFVFTLSLAVFVASNPLLYADFFFGIRCLTSEHLNRHGGHAALGNYPSLRYLIVYPFILFRPVVFTMNQSINFVVLQARDYLFALGGYVLLIAGLRQRSGKLEYLVLAWGVSIFSMIGFVLLSLLPYAVYTRIFLLPSIALIWIISFLLSRGEQG